MSSHIFYRGLKVSRMRKRELVEWMNKAVTKSSNSGKSIYNLSTDQIPTLVDILVNRCYANETKIYEGCSNIKQRLWYVLKLYVLYKKYKLSRYFLLYSSNKYKINAVLKGEFTCKHSIQFYSNLHLNRMEVDVDKLIKSMDNPYLHILKYPGSYSSEDLYVEWSKHKKVTPDNTLLKMIPGKCSMLLYEKVKWLLHNEYGVDIVKSDSVTYLSNPESLHSNRLLFIDVESSQTHSLSRDQYRDTKKILMIDGYVGDLYEPSYLYNIIWYSEHIEYVRFIINKIIKNNKIDKAIEKLDGDRIPYVNYCLLRIKWMIEYDLVNNELFRYFYHYLCNKEYRQFGDSYDNSRIKLLKKYFSYVDC